MKKNSSGIYLTELARGIGLTFPTIKAWLPGLHIKLKRVKHESTGRRCFWMSHADASKITAFANTKKMIKEAREK